MHILSSLLVLSAIAPLSWGRGIVIPSDGIASSTRAGGKMGPLFAGRELVGQPLTSRAIGNDSAFTKVLQPAPAGPMDESLSLKEYADAGVPPHDRTWGAEDYADAFEALTKLTKKKGLQVLPRMNSPRSGKLFDRIGTVENFRNQKFQQLPLGVQIVTLGGQMDAGGLLIVLYVEALRSEKVTFAEVTELSGAALRMAVLMMELYDKFVAGIDKDDPDLKIRMAFNAELKREGAGMVRSGLSVVSNLRYPLENRKKYFGILMECLPSIVARLTPEARRKAEEKLDELCDDAAKYGLVKDLPALREAVKAAVKKFQ